MATAQLNILENNLYTIIDKLKRQRKRADTNSIYDNLIINADFQNISKEVIQDKIDDLIIEENILNKINRGKNSYWVNEEKVDTAIETTVNLLHNFTLVTPNISPSNSPKRNDNNNSITPFSLETPETTQNEDKKNENVKNTEDLIDQMYNKIQAQQFKEEILSQAKETMNHRFETELISFKSKCEKLVSKAYENYNTHIINLEQQIQNKDKIIEDLLQTIKEITTSKISPDIGMQSENLNTSFIESEPDHNFSISNNETIDIDQNQPISNETVTEYELCHEESIADPVLKAINKYKRQHGYSSNNLLYKDSSADLVITKERDTSCTTENNNPSNEVKIQEASKHPDKSKHNKNNKQKIFILGDSMVKTINGWSISENLKKKKCLCTIIFWIKSKMYGGLRQTLYS